MDNIDKTREDEAYEALIKYLSAAPRSEKECKDKLYTKGFHRGEVDFAIEKAAHYGFIDDEQYARSFINYNLKKFGGKKLAYKLTFEKGVNKDIVDKIFDELVSEDDQKELCKSYAAAYIARRKISDKTDAGKVSAYLYQKGFDYGVINSVMATLFDVDADF